MSRDEKKALIDRREFTSTTVMALLAGVTVTVTGCSSGGNDNPAGPSGPGGGSMDVTGSVADNHGHTAVITSAEIAAGQSITLDIRGSSDHPHTVSISMAELSQITAGVRVNKTSTSDNSGIYGPHSHNVSFN